MRSLKSSDWLLIVTNFVPVFGVFFLGWNAVEAFVVYALETLMVGMLTVCKMLVVTVYRKKDIWYSEAGSKNVSGFFFIFFFIVHYGLFAAVQTSIFAEAADILPPRAWPLHFFFHWYEYVNRDIAYMLIVFVVSYIVRSFIPFLLRGEYKTVSIMRLMFQPYGRIFIQQATVILGSMFLSVGVGKMFILVFALVKIYFEIYVDLNKVINKSMDGLEQQSTKK